MKEVLTGNYENCKIGNLISISKDKGQKVNFNGSYLQKLAPKIDFSIDWINEKNFSNIKDYINKYYTDILSQIDPQELFDSLPDLAILLDYDDKMYRHLVAFWLELFLGIETYEIAVNPKRETLKVVQRPEYLKGILENVIKDNYDMNGFDNIKDAYSYNKSMKNNDYMKKLILK